MVFPSTQREWAMIKQLLKLPAIVSAALVLASLLTISVSQAQTAPPPSLGEETKGTPAIDENKSQGATSSSDNKSETTNDANGEETQSTSVFGASTVVESRRESGQVYSIELQHSNAPTQYIEETDSDGNIEYKSNDLEVTPNLPKWKIGSW